MRNSSSPIVSLQGLLVVVVVGCGGDGWISIWTLLVISIVVRGCGISVSAWYQGSRRSAQDSGQKRLGFA